MAENKIGNIDAVSASLSSEEKSAKVEYDLLNLSAEVQKWEQSELRQRVVLRWLAFFVGMAVVIFMGFFLGHALHNIFVGPLLFIDSAVVVSLIVVPTFSITSITIALLVGAFRKFKNKDFDRVSVGAKTGIGLIP